MEVIVRGRRQRAVLAQEYTLKKVGGSWRIASERDLGLWPDGTLNEDLGG